MRQRQPVHQNKRFGLISNGCAQRGFTLIEVLVTLLVMAFGLLASVIGIMSALDYSLVNEMRNDALKLAQEQVEWARNMPYINISTIPAAPQTITRQVRKRVVNYTVTFTTLATASGGATKGVSLVNVLVTWPFKNSVTNINRTYKYVLQSIIRQTK